MDIWHLSASELSAARRLKYDHMVTRALETTQSVRSRKVHLHICPRVQERQPNFPKAHCRRIESEVPSGLKVQDQRAGRWREGEGQGVADGRRERSSI